MISEISKESIEAPQVPYDLKNFKLSKILSNNTNRKTIVLLGAFEKLPGEELALIILEKLAFTEENVATDSQNRYFDNFSKVDTILVNSEYGSFKCFPEGQLNGKLSIFNVLQFHINPNPQV